jgi:hypothetical protein
MQGPPMPQQMAQIPDLQLLKATGL